MRSIKFRAWDGERMYYYDKISTLHNKEVLVIEPEKSAKTYVDESDYNDNLEFMQFTGLTDKNGVDIFEGDVIEIIEAHSDESQGGYCDCDFCFSNQGNFLGKIGNRGIIVYFKDSFQACPATKEGLGAINGGKNSKCLGCISQFIVSIEHDITIGNFCKVSGNIHEHPNLIK